MKPTPAIATVADDFDPYNPRAVIGNNQPPANDNAPTPFDLIKQEIEDLFMEATNWADGEAIQDQQTHDAIDTLFNGLHAAGAKADKLRVEEKKPFDDKIDEIQKRYAPLIADNKSAKGKVTLGKAELQKLLTPWRDAQRIAKEQEAARIAAEAAEATRIAQEAIRASAGNLAGRVEAEELLAHAAAVTKQAARADKQATTGTGLRTVFRAELVDSEAALEWWYGERPEEFTALVQRLADSAVAAGVRKVPGFNVVEDKIATAGRAR